MFEDVANGMTFPEGTAYFWYAYTFVLFFLSCLALYGIVYELFRSHKLSLLAFFLYYLSPRFFAEGHYNNKDVVFLGFGLITVYFAIRWLYTRRHLWGFFFALSAALMTNVKILGAWFFAVPGIVYLITLIRKKEFNAEKVIDGLRVIFAYALIYVAVTPAIWTHGLNFFGYCLENATRFSRWGGKVIYAGKEITMPIDRVPMDYLPLNILYTTPLILIVLFLAGFAVVLTAIVKRGENAAVYGMVLVLYLVPFGYAIFNDRLVVYNGWRHFYFLYGGMVIFMAVGCRAILLSLKRRWLRYAAGISVVVYLLCLVVTGHPFQYSYLNILVERPAEKDWQLDYWDISNRTVLNRLYENEDRNRELELTVSGYELIEAEILYKDNWNGEMRYIYPGGEEKANYMLCNPVYFEPPGEGYRLLFTVEAYGNCLYQVYEIE